MLDEDMVDVNRRDTCDYSPLYLAVRNNRNATLNVVKMLVTAGADVNAQCILSPLFYAASISRNLEVVKYLVEAGANVNMEYNEWSPTPLVGATENGRVEVVKFLVEAGADLNKTDHKGRTPLHIAAEKGYLEIQTVLVKAMYKIK